MHEMTSTIPTGRGSGRRGRAAAFCDAILAETQAIMADAGRSSHERFIAVYNLMQERNSEAIEGFDYPARETKGAAPLLAAAESVDGRRVLFSVLARDVRAGGGPDR